VSLFDNGISMNPFCEMANRQSPHLGVAKLQISMSAWGCRWDGRWGKWEGIDYKNWHTWPTNKYYSLSVGWLVYKLSTTITCHREQTIYDHHRCPYSAVSLDYSCSPHESYIASRVHRFVKIISESSRWRCFHWLFKIFKWKNKVIGNRSHYL
jgi:hypothetical protein